jgi:hypothetical protein
MAMLSHPCLNPGRHAGVLHLPANGVGLAGFGNNSQYSPEKGGELFRDTFTKVSRNISQE